MPYQSSTSFSLNDNRAFESYLNDSLASTQPASNESTTTPTSHHIINTSNNTPIQHYRSNAQSSYRNAVPIILQTPSPTTTEPTSIFNNEYGCRSVLAKMKSTCKTELDYFKQLYCMYSGCEGHARNRIEYLLDSKDSSLSKRSIKIIKKQSVDELLRR